MRRDNNSCSWHISTLEPSVFELTIIAVDIKFIAVGRALTRDVVAALAVNKNDNAEQYYTAVRLHGLLYYMDDVN